MYNNIQPYFYLTPAHSCFACFVGVSFAVIIMHSQGLNSIVLFFPLQMGVHHFDLVKSRRVGVGPGA